MATRPRDLAHTRRCRNVFFRATHENCGEPCTIQSGKKISPFHSENSQKWRSIWMKFRKNFLFAPALFFSFFTFFYMGKSAGLKSSINSLSHPQLNFSSKNSNSHGPGDNPKLAPTISLKNALAANRATLLSYLFSEAFQADLAQNETFSQLTHKF